MRDVLGKFQIVKLLGKGAMGEVYLGRDPKLGREVALKVISAGTAFGEEAQIRFEREARAAALLNHPHIVTVYEFGEEEGIHYLAMEYVQGDDLEGLIQKGKTPKAQLLEVLAQVCEGLAYAHERGVIHRDIKPANVLVTKHGKRLHAKLMDFGIAQMGPSGLTQAGTWMGTASYMAPEYLDTGKTSTGTDLFALGVMLYEILSGGRKPFQGDTATSVLNRILLHPPDPLHPEDLNGVPRRLLAVTERAMAKRPEERYPDAEALATAIREALEDAEAETAEPQTAEPQTAPRVVPPPAEREITGHRIRVGKGGQCLSLKVALRQARAGTEIEVLPGTYREALVVDKDVVIMALGEPGEVIIEGVGGPAMVLSARHVTLRDLVLRTHEEAAAAVQITSGAPVLDRCVLQGGRAGLLLDKGAQIRMQGGAVRGFQEGGVRLAPGGMATLLNVEVGPGGGVGLWLGPRSQAMADECRFSAEGGGVEVETDARVQLGHCQLVGSQFAGLLALERSHAVLDGCELTDHAATGVHILAGANVLLRDCQVAGNAGFGISVMDRGLATLEGCRVQGNGGAGLLIHHGATVQARNSAFSEGKAMGVDCAEGGQGVLDGCDISGNAGAGVQVEPGGSLLLVRCVLKDGRDTGLLLLEDSQVTLEECVVHRNARGGVLLARDAADPLLRGGNRLEDEFRRVDGAGNLVRVVPIQQH
jgi:nitrous oxidase accessory protein NosD/predicted Ser/Thr protein kinase